MSYWFCFQTLKSNVQIMAPKINQKHIKLYPTVQAVEGRGEPSWSDQDGLRWASTSFLAMLVSPERRLGPARLPSHAFLVWRSSRQIVVYIYYVTTAGNSIRWQLGSSCQGNRYGTGKAGGTVRPSCTKSHLLGRSPSANQAGRRVGLALSSLRPYWVSLLRFTFFLWLQLPVSGPSIHVLLRIKVSYTR